MIILQEHHRFFRSFPGKRPVRITAGALREFPDIRIRHVEEPALKFDAQDTPGRPADRRCRYDPFPRFICKRPEACAAPELVVHPRLEGEDARFERACGRKVVAICHFHSATVAHDEPVESPFRAEDVVEQLPVDVVGDAIPFVVRGHERPRVRPLHGHFERVEMIFAEFALGVVDRCDVSSPLGLPVSCKVLERGGNVIAVDKETPPLESEYGGHPHARDEVGILAVTFLGPSPAGIPGQVENG